MELAIAPVRLARHRATAGVLMQLRCHTQGLPMEASLPSLGLSIIIQKAYLSHSSQDALT